MKKTFSLLTIFLFFSLLSLFHATPTYAACSSPLAIDQPTLAPKFNDIITITSNTDPCFGNVDFTVIAYPSRLDAGWPSSVIKTDNHAPFFYTLRTDEKTISGNLNLAIPDAGPDAGGRIYIQGENAPGSWTVLVCQKTGNLRDCKANLLGTTSFTVSTQAPTSTLTPTSIPSNLPKVFMFPPVCKYRTGESLELTLDNLSPNTTYRWWWWGDISQKAFATYQQTGTSAKATIDGQETQQVGARTLCVDFLGSGVARCTPGSQNSAPLTFTPTAPTGDTSCSTTPSGGVGQPTPTLTITPAAPTYPCATPPDPSSGKGCEGVDTALGYVPTDPSQLIKTIFTVLLSMAGGWAVFLIITAGYQLMFSQGEAEATKEAREKITSAIIGIVFMILSYAILKVIGVDIFALPTFGR